MSNGDRVVAQGDGFHRGRSGDGGNMARSNGERWDAVNWEKHRTRVRRLCGMEDSEEHLSVQYLRSPISHPYPFHGLGTPFYILETLPWHALAHGATIFG